MDDDNGDKSNMKEKTLLRKTIIAVMLAFAVSAMAALPASAQNFFPFDFDDDNFDRDSGDSQVAESGDVNQDINVTGGGDNSNQCVGIQPVANTGNVQNQLSLDETPTPTGDNLGDNNDLSNDEIRDLLDDPDLTGSEIDDIRDAFFDDDNNNNNNFGNNGSDLAIDDSGAELTVDPVNTTSCTQTVDQAAAASGW